MARNVDQNSVTAGLTSMCHGFVAINRFLHRCPLFLEEAHTPRAKCDLFPVDIIARYGKCRIDTGIC